MDNVPVHPTWVLSPNPGGRWSSSCARFVQVIIPPTCDKTSRCKQEVWIVLLNQLERCENHPASSSSYCVKLNQEMRESTKGVQEWCNGLRSKNYCKVALNALTKSNATPPSEASPPSSKSCKELTNEMISKEEERRDPDSGGSYSNSFWRNMGDLASKVCKESTAGTPKVMGVCDVSPDEMSNYTQKTYKKYKRGEEGFNRCTENKLSGHRDQRIKFSQELRTLNKKMEDLRRSITSTVNPEEYKNLNEKIKKLESSIAFKDEVINNIKSKNECGGREDEELLIGQEGSIDDLSSDIINKIKSGRTALANGEENLFKSITGLDSENFKKAFCNNSYDAFKDGLKWATIKQQEIIANMSFDFNKTRQKQADAAWNKMKKCRENLKTVTETGCKMKELRGPYLQDYLEQVSEDNPILIKDSSNECKLILSHEKREISTGIDLITDQHIKRTASVIGFKTNNIANSPKKEIMTPEELDHRFSVFYYSCDHNSTSLSSTAQGTSDGDSNGQGSHSTQ